MSAVNVKGIHQFVVQAQIEAASALNKAVDAKVTAHYQSRGWYTGPVIVDHSWNWSSVTINQFGPVRPKTQREKDEEKADTAKIWGSIIAVVAGAVAGLLYSSWTDKRSQMQEVKQMQEAIDNGSVTQAGITAKAMEDLDRLVTVVLKNRTLEMSKVNGYFGATVGILVSSSAWAVGGFLVAPWVMVAGQVGLLFSAIVTTINWGVHYNDSSLLAKGYAEILGNPRENRTGLADSFLFEMQRREAVRNTPVGDSNIADGIPLQFSPLVPDCYKEPTVNLGYYVTPVPSAPPSYLHP